MNRKDRRPIPAVLREWWRTEEPGSSFPNKDSVIARATPDITPVRPVYGLRFASDACAFLRHRALAGAKCGSRRIATRCPPSCLSCRRGLFCLMVSLRLPWRAEQIRDIRVNVAVRMCSTSRGGGRATCSAGTPRCLLTGLHYARAFRYFPQLHSYSFAFVFIPQWSTKEGKP